MGNRLTQIATRTGDNGTTGLGDNQRVSKNSLRVHAMGDVDELNSNLGVLLCEPMPDEVRNAAGGDPAPAVQPRRRAQHSRL
jgi:cob(I)alamin adenosyltransferase